MLFDVLAAVAALVCMIRLCGETLHTAIVKNKAFLAVKDRRDELDRTKRVLAAEMGTTSETLSRTLGKFRDKNILRVRNNTITVMKPRELQKLLQQNLGEL